MLEDFQTINVFSPNIGEIALNLGISLLCGLFITFIYKKSYKGPGYSNSFVNSIIFLSLITTLVIMVIGNNLARAFGLVGAMSIIRFRTAVKETLDIVYIFFGLSIGMASGVGYHRLAITGTVIIGIILFVFSKTDFLSLRKDQYLLQFTYFLQEEKNNLFSDILNKFCRRFEIINIKTTLVESEAEYSYYVSLKKSEQANFLLSELAALNGMKNINLYFDEEHI